MTDVRTAGPADPALAAPQGSESNPGASAVAGPAEAVPGAAAAAPGAAGTDPGAAPVVAQGATAVAPASTAAGARDTGKPWLTPATAPVGGRRGARPAAVTTRGRGVRPRHVVVGAVLLAAIGFLLFKGIGTSLDYYVTVRQALAEQGSLHGKTIRLKGIVMPGTISHHGTTVDFTVAQEGDRSLRIPVIEHGSPPQLFREGVPVIVQGRFTGATFVSDQVIVDHTGNYSPERDGPRSSTASSAS